jgi:two-component system, sensor histidine kinase PdtaS
MSEKPIFYTLKKSEKHHERLRDLHAFFIKVSRSLTLATLLLAMLLLLLSGIPKTVSLSVMGFGLLIGVNLWIYTHHKRLSLAGILLAVLTFLSSFIVIQFSGGLNSPYIFVLLILCFTGYTISRALGSILLISTATSLIILRFGLLEPVGLRITEIPEESRLYFTTLCLLYAAFLLIGSIAGQLRGLHERMYAEKSEVENRLNEKEILLKEVHHRVKNNLQTVSSLLRMQGRNIEDEGILHLIQSSQNRVVAMAMVHEMLYMREDLAKIDYRTYVTELGGYLIKSLKGPESKITLHIDIPQIELGIDTAIPLGLLINEAVTNALKYGFKERETGEISILLERESKTEYVLRIGDNGVGYPESVTHKSTKSLGLKLIYNLSRQLQGSVIRDLTKEGTNYVIRFHELNPSSFHSLA